MKISQKTSRRHKEKSDAFWQNDVAYGRANRPHTPVTGIINNAFGSDSEEVLQQRYSMWKAQRATSKGAINIRMTNA